MATNRIMVAELLDNIQHLVARGLDIQEPRVLQVRDILYQIYREMKLGGFWPEEEEEEYDEEYNEE